MPEFDEAAPEAVARIVFCPVCTTNDEQQDDELIFECNNCETEYALELVQTEEPDDGGFDGAIIFCPHCSKGMDAEGLGLRNYECPSCEQPFAVRLEADRLAAHAMYGAVNIVLIAGVVEFLRTI